MGNTNKSARREIVQKSYSWTLVNIQQPTITEPEFLDGCLSAAEDAQLLLVATAMLSKLEDVQNTKRELEESPSEGHGGQETQLHLTQCDELITKLLNDSLMILRTVAVSFAIKCRTSATPILDLQNVPVGAYQMFIAELQVQMPLNHYNPRHLIIINAPFVWLVEHHCKQLGMAYKYDGQKFIIQNRWGGDSVVCVFFFFATSAPQ